MKQKHRRLAYVLLGLAALGAATALMLAAIGDGMVYFYTPGDLAANHVGPDKRLRIGGLVEPGSVVKDGPNVTFAITDERASLPVRYQGVLPDLFREGQGVVAEGRLDGKGAFVASEVLAKHDENYMPREVQDALKKSGHWGDEYTKK